MEFEKVRYDPQPTDGSQWEYEVFGCERQQFRIWGPRQSFWQSCDQVMKNQARYDWNPRHPMTAMGWKLFCEVRKRLERRYARDLQLYCAVGSPLDICYGVDGFFCVRNFFTFMDLTTNPKKEVEDRIVFVRRNNGFELELTALRIAQDLRDKIRRR